MARLSGTVPMQMVALLGTVPMPMEALSRPRPSISLALLEGAILRRTVVSDEAILAHKTLVSYTAVAGGWRLDRSRQPKGCCRDRYSKAWRSWIRRIYRQLPCVNIRLVGFGC